MAGVIPIIGDNQFDRAVTLPKPMDFPAAKNFFCSFSFSFLPNLLYKLTKQHYTLVIFLFQYTIHQFLIILLFFYFYYSFTFGNTLNISHN